MAIVGMTMAVGVGVAIASSNKNVASVHATTTTYQHVFNAKPSVGNNISLSSVNWTVSATNLGNYNNLNYAGVQVGTSSKTADFEIESSYNWGDQEGTYKGKTVVTEIRLWLNAGATGTINTLSASVGGTPYTPDTTSITKNSSAGSSWSKATKIVFSNLSAQTGKVDIHIGHNANRALYICCLEIDCEEPAQQSGTLDNISLSGTYPTAFTVGDSFSHEGMTVTANYVDPTGSSDVTDSATFTGYNMSEAGNQTVTVGYGGKSTTYDITVSAPVAVTSVSLNKSSATIAKGSTETLTATVSPNNASNKNITWESDDEDVATVDENGVVTGIAAGTAHITAKSVADNTKSGTCTVTVVGPTYSLPSITAFDNIQTSYTSGTVYTNQELTHTVSETAYNWQVSSFEWWSSGTQCCLGDYKTSNGAWATFSGYDSFTNITKGLVDNSIGSSNRTFAMFTKSFGFVRPTKAVFGCTGITDGTTASNGNNLYILGSNNNGISWDKLGESHPSGAANIGTTKPQSVSWENNTKYTSNAPVLFALVYTSSNTKTDTDAPAIRNPYFEVYGESVNNSATWNAGKITISGASTHVEVGQDLELTANKAPSFAQNPTIAWSSSNNEVATVDSNGVVRGVAVGSVTITATTGDGVSAEYSVTVDAATVHVSSVELDESALNVKQAGSATLTATISPADATDKSVTWSITGDSDITVDQNGKVSVAGSATVGDTARVTVTSTDGSKTDTCDITVTAFVGEYTKLTDATKLYPGMQFVLVCEDEDRIAGEIADGKAFLSDQEATIVGDGVSSESETVFTLGGSVNNWTLTTSQGLLYATAAKALAFDSDAQSADSTWSITITDGDVFIDSNTDSYGCIKFNKSSPRFLNYASGQTNIQLYAKDEANTAEGHIYSFIRNNMRMGDTSLSGDGVGACKSNGYYAAAKAAFNGVGLTNEERAAFFNELNTQYAAARARLSAWARANGESFDAGDSVLKANNLNSRLTGFTSGDSNDAVLIVAILSAGALAIGGLALTRKRRNED